MRILSRPSLLGFILAMSIVVSTGPARPAESSPVDQVLNSIVARENEIVRRLQQYRPLVETYGQTLVPDRRLGAMPVRDDYFLGRLELPRGLASGAAANSGKRRKLLDLFKEFYAHSFSPDGFARMIVLDADSFDRAHYDFEFVRREFLGEVRTLVFEVTPKDSAPSGRFVGRIWVEDLDFTIVRYNGAYASESSQGLHFDSWRINVQPGLWFPAYIYTEESESAGNGQLKQKYKGQTRIWGYETKRRAKQEEFAKVLVEAPLAADQSESAGDVSPVRSLRAWEREAEENVIQRLEKGGIVAPDGEVDEVLRTVVTNLEITNSLDIQPPVRCRVLLTSPLESFTVGHTIVLSRGLIDVLPDEASLAMVLAHELGHILLGHQLDTKYAFGDHMLVGDKEAMEQFFFRRDQEEEAEADEKALMLLENSPYKGKLDGAGLFLKALSLRSAALPALIRPHFGNRMTKRNKLVRMTRILDSAPELYMTALNQTAALPLGGRVKVDPWDGHIELMKNTQVVLLSPREKLPFEVTPLMPHLVRLGDGGRLEAAQRLDRPAPDPAAVVGAELELLAPQPTPPNEVQ